MPPIRLTAKASSFKTLTQPNVELVSDSTDHVARDGIITVDGTLRPHDVVVQSQMAAQLDIPNLALMLGPNFRRPCSVIVQPEYQSRDISACLVEIIENNIAAIDVRPDAHDRYIRDGDIVS